VTLLLGNGLALSSALAHALFDGVWVGALIALAMHCYLLWRRDLSAASRHAAWYAALICIAALPVVSLATSLSRVSVQTTAAPEPVHLSAIAGTATAPVVAHGTPGLAAPAFRASARPSFPILRLVKDAIPTLAVAAAAIALARLATLLAGLFGLARVKRESRIVDASVAPPLARAIGSSPKARAVHLRISETIEAPAAAGFRTPAILLPAGLLESVEAEALGQIAMHEYAHLQRYDDWTNLAARVIERLYWFNPAVWFVSGRVDLERELACDDWAVADAKGVSGYADCLWQLAQEARVPAFAATAPGAFLTRNQVVARIEHLLERSRDGSRRPRAAKLLAFAPVLAAALVLAAGRAPSIALHVQPAARSIAAAPQRYAAPAVASRVRTGHEAIPRIVAVIAVTGSEAPKPSKAVAAPPELRALVSYAPVQATSRTARTIERKVTLRTTRRSTVDHVAMRMALLSVAAPSSTVRSVTATVATAETLADAATDVTDGELAASVETDAGSPAEIDRNILAHCSGCDMSGKDLRGADLHGLSLSGDDLSDADLRGANLRGTIFIGVDLTNARLDGADLRNAELTGSDIDGATFAGAKTDGLKLIGMQLNNSILETVSVRWIVGNCSGCDLSGLDLHGRDLHGITLSGADLNNADLHDANLSGAHLNGVDLEGADLEGADLTNAQLNGCDLQGANLDHARTQGLQLQGSTLGDSDSNSDTSAGSSDSRR
jgi:uncharacterized protein YjbI with pentapeptide repeats/beta-lactamase regulating signal transducer with metallopeptidase domain